MQIYAAASCLTATKMHLQTTLIGRPMQQFSVTSLDLFGVRFTLWQWHYAWYLQMKIISSVKDSASDTAIIY
jgi:hypothetical protein